MMMRSLLPVAAGITLVGLGSFVVACGGDGDLAEPTGVEAMCALNEEFAALNERTLPADIEKDPFPDPELLEENFVEGVRLMRAMVAEAPDEIAADLGAYADAIAKLSEIYADYGFDREAVWEDDPYEERFEPYAVPEETRATITEWFVANCGKDLQG